MLRQPYAGFFDYVVPFLYPKILFPMVFLCFFFVFFFVFSVGICLIYVFYQSLVSSQMGTIYGTRDCYFQPFNAFWTVLLNPNLSLVVSSLLFAYDSLLYCTFNISSTHCVYAAYYNLIFIRCVLPSRFNHYTRPDESVIGPTYPLIGQRTTFLIDARNRKGCIPVCFAGPSPIFHSELRPSLTPHLTPITVSHFCLSENALGNVGTGLRRLRYSQ